jgi:hypothetical protein
MDSSKRWYADREDRTLSAAVLQPNQAGVLNRGKAFRRNEVSSGPVRIADISAAAPQMAFVPSLP